MRKILIGAALSLLLGASPVLSASSVVNLAAPTGNVGLGTDGTNGLNIGIICGATASSTLYATCVNQAIVNSSGQFLTLSSPAANSVWSTTYGPNQASITGNITTVDTGVTCANTAAGQDTCTGSPTANSFVTGAINGAGCLGVSSSLSGGTATATLSTEISMDNVNWYPRGLFLDGKNAPIWINNATGGVFGGETPGGGVAFYRVRASALTVLTGTPTFAITIVPSQAACVNYAGNLPTAANGSGSVASVNIQGGGGSALNVGVNQVQQAGVALAAPTVAGTSATGNIPGWQGVSGGVPVAVVGTVTASFSQFAPNGNYSTPLTVGSTSSRTALPSGGGSTIAIYNVGSNAAFVQLGNSSVAATAANDQVPPSPGFLCFAVGSNTFLAAIETAGATTLNISGGSGGCAGSGGGGGGGGSSGNVFQANAFVNGSTSSAATTQELAPSGSTVVYLVNYAVQTDQAATAPGTFQIVTGTGTNCATSQVALTPVWNFPAGQGIQEGSLGVLGVSAAGAALCVKTTTANQVNWRIGVVQQ